MEIKFNKINYLFNKSYFTKKNQKKNKLKLVKENKLLKSLIDNIYVDIENEYKTKLNKSNEINLNSSYKTKKCFRIKKIKKKKLTLKEIISKKFKFKLLICSFKIIIANSIFNPNVRIKPYLFHYKNTLVLFGGYSCKNYIDIWIFNLKNKKWYLISKEIKKIKEIRNLNLVLKNDELVFFGTKSIIISNRLKLVNYKLIYNLKTNIIKKKIDSNIKKTSKCIISKVSNNIYIKLGGYIDNKINNNMIIFSIDEWDSNIIQICSKIYEKGLFNCKIVSVFNKNYDTLVNFLNELHSLSNSEGFYIFGGYNINWEAYEGIHFLTIKNKQLILNKLSPKGIFPQNLNNYEIISFKEINKIVILGGINYYNTNEINNKIILYDILTNNIISSKIEGMIEKYSFGCCTDEDYNIYTFGGLDYNGFTENNINCISLKFNKFN